jgi:hypothetical protein
MMTAVLAFLSRYWQLIAVAVAALAISAVFHLALSLLLLSTFSKIRKFTFASSSCLSRSRKLILSAFGTGVNYSESQRR